MRPIKTIINVGVVAGGGVMLFQSISAISKAKKGTTNRGAAITIAILGILVAQAAIRFAVENINENEL